MFRFALTVFALVALSTIAHAATPPEMQGTWCYASDNGAKDETLLSNGYHKLVTKYNKVANLDKCDLANQPEYLTIDKDGFDRGGQGCSVASYALIGAEENRPVYRVNFAPCGGNSFTWNETWMTYLTADGQLSVRIKASERSKVTN
jgi:hypothetical protein